jgi:hypothetical protein
VSQRARTRPANPLAELTVFPAGPNMGDTLATT